MTDGLVVPVEPGAPSGQGGVGQGEIRMVDDGCFQGRNSLRKIAGILQHLCRFVSIFPGCHE
jgi:hypothetical protein